MAAGGGHNTRINTKRLTAWAAITGGILLIPLIAMQFSEDVTWTVFDFIFAGILLFGAGLAFELVTSRMRNTAYLAATGVALGAGVLLIVVTGAVGVIGSEENDANLMYAGVPPRRPRQRHHRPIRTPRHVPRHARHCPRADHRRHHRARRPHGRQHRRPLVA
jgi:hypothetical protein